MSKTFLWPLHSYQTMNHINIHALDLPRGSHSAKHVAGLESGTGVVLMTAEHPWGHLPSLGHVNFGGGACDEDDDDNDDDDDDDEEEEEERFWCAPSSLYLLSYPLFVECVPHKRTHTHCTPAQQYRGYLISLTFLMYVRDLCYHHRPYWVSVTN